MYKKELEHFILEETDNRIDIKFKSNNIHFQLENEISGLMKTAYFGIKADIRIIFSNIEYVNYKIFLALLNVGKELFDVNRSLILKDAPESFQRFIIENHLEEFLKLES